MLIGDGVVPGNEGRGYVLRRLLRRVVRNARLLGITEPVLVDLAGVVRDAMGPSYPEIVTSYERIAAVRAPRGGGLPRHARHRLADLRVGGLQTSGPSGSTTLPGSSAFALHDTYGFPIDLTLEMASEAGLEVDEGAFRSLMDEQRSRAKADAAARKHGGADASAYREVLERTGLTDFLGYSDQRADATIVGLIVDHVGVPAATEGDEVEVMLDRTPFYAEGGGQQADTGRLFGDGFTIEITDVQTPVPGLSVHRGRVLHGEATLDAPVSAQIDVERRAAISRAHTATHLVHAGMRKALGDSAAQAGSLNAPGRLRFDFTSPEGAVPASVLADVEDEVNTVLLGDDEVRAFVTSMDEARKLGAVALFGEKYGDAVRIVEVGEYSRELCGGTHVGRSGQLGLVKLMGEGSIGSGVRRVEALVGIDAFRFLAREHVLVNQLAEQFRAQPEELPERIGGVVERLRAAEKELETIRAREVLSSAGSLVDGAEDVGGIALVAARTPEGVGGGDLRSLAGDVRGRLAGPAGRRRALRARRGQGLVRRRHHRGRPRARPGRRRPGQGVRARGERPGRRQAGPGPGRWQRRRPGSTTPSPPCARRWPALAADEPAGASAWTSAACAWASPCPIPAGCSRHRSLPSITMNRPAPTWTGWWRSSTSTRWSRWSWGFPARWPDARVRPRRRPRTTRRPCAGGCPRRGATSRSCCPTSA